MARPDGARSRGKKPEDRSISRGEEGAERRRRKREERTGRWREEWVPEWVPEHEQASGQE